MPRERSVSLTPHQRSFFFLFSFFLYFLFLQYMGSITGIPNWSICREKVVMGCTVPRRYSYNVNSRRQVQGISLKKGWINWKRQRTRTPGIRCCPLDVIRESVPRKCQEGGLNKIHFPTTAAGMPIPDRGTLTRPAPRGRAMTVSGCGERGSPSPRGEPKCPEHMCTQATLSGLHRFL